MQDSYPETLLEHHILIFTISESVSNKLRECKILTFIIASHTYHSDMF